MKSRKDALIQWLIEATETSQFTLESASEDASFRSYYRLVIKSTDPINNQCKSFIVMDAPPELEDCEPFIKIQKLLAAHQINVPQIHACDPDQGFMLLSDFGSTLYLDELDTNTAYDLYPMAISELVAIQRITDTQALPRYDAHMLGKELTLFSDWFINTHLDHILSSEQHKTLDTIHKLLIENAISQPQVMVHRDYHSRNIMLTNNRPGIIDFQDAVLGPISYDLASLLKDCYISWDDADISNWVHLYLDQYNNVANETINYNQFIKWFDLMAAQRHMKAIGIFCRLNYRDGKKHYLYDIPRTMNYLTETCHKYPELTDFGHLLNSLKPVLNQSA